MKDGFAYLMFFFGIALMLVGLGFCGRLISSNPGPIIEIRMTNPAPTP